MFKKLFLGTTVYKTSMLQKKLMKCARCSTNRCYIKKYSRKFKRKTSLL